MRITLALLLLAVTTQAQVARRVQGDGLVAWWPFEDAQVTDRSGSGNNLTMTDGGALVRGYVGGGRDTAKLFCDSNSTLQFTNQFTVSAFVRLTTLTSLGNNGPAIVGKWVTQSGNRSYVFHIQETTGKLGCAVSSDGNYDAANEVYGVNQIALGKWYHVAVTFNSGAVVFYVNGSRDVTRSTTATSIRVNTTPVHVFNQDGVSRQLNGVLDDVRIYNRALSPQEVAALTNSRRRNHSQ